MYDTVIVPLDGSELAERAIAPAAWVAQRAGAVLVPMMVGVATKHDENRAYLEHATSGLGVDTRPPFILSDAHPSDCIANAGEAEGSLIVMTTHGRSGLGRAVIGSVAEGVLRLLRKPVLLIGPNCSTDWPDDTEGPVVTPQDGSDRSLAILPSVAGWCRLLGRDARVIGGIDDEEALAAQKPSVQPEGDVVDAVSVHGVATDIQAEGVGADWEVLHDGAAADSLIDDINGARASLVAMTTHGHTGLARLALGSVAARIVHEVSCPVLTLRPELS